MKTYHIEIPGQGSERVVTKPDNCNHPRLWPPVDCKAPHKDNPECDCRWCVFNKEYNKANERS